MHPNFSMTIRCLEEVIDDLAVDLKPDTSRYWWSGLIDTTIARLALLHGFEDLEHASRLSVWGSSTIFKLEPSELSNLGNIANVPSNKRFQNINERKVVNSLPGYRNIVPELVSFGNLKFRTNFGTDLYFSYNEYEMVQPLPTYLALDRSRIEYVEALLDSHGSLWVETEPLNHWGRRDSDSPPLLVDFG